MWMGGILLLSRNFLSLSKESSLKEESIGKCDSEKYDHAFYLFLKRVL